MKGGFAFLLFAVVTAACFREDTHRSINDTIDSTKLITSKNIAREKAIWKYYALIEEEVKKDLGVSEKDVIERIQSMIDDGYVKKPIILVIAGGGSRWAAVDYSTYKEYMTGNAIVLRRFYGTQPDVLDTVFMASIRNNLLEALKAEGTASEIYASP